MCDSPHPDTTGTSCATSDDVAQLRRELKQFHDDVRPLIEAFNRAANSNPVLRRIAGL
jgi:hypothetical protein